MRTKIAVHAALCLAAALFIGLTPSTAPAFSGPGTTVLTARDCPSGFVWNPGAHRCVPIRQPKCPIGFRWDRRRYRCVRKATGPKCPIGYGWNPRRMKCMKIKK